MTLEPISRASTVDLCARTLRDAVLRGDYPAGERLPPERALATTLGVNRVTVRGALAALVSEGLLSVRQGSGYEVRDALSSGGIELLPALAAHHDRKQATESVRDLLSVRRAIAGVVLERLAHRKAKRAELEAISRAIDVLSATEGAPEKERAEADLAVLRAVVAATGSAALQLVLNPISEVLLALPGLQAAMFRSPAENALGWRGLLAWLEAPDAQTIPTLLAVLADRDDATLSFFRRHA